METFLKITTFLYLFSIVFCEDTASTQLSLNNLQDLSDKLQNIPGVENLPINSSSVPSAEEVKDILRKKCEKNGGPGAFERVETATSDVEQCFKNLINTTVLQQEIEEKKATGSLDVVFKKYCQKFPLFKECISTYTDTIDACLEEKEKDSKKMVLNVTESLANFVCFKDGDRIAMFIAEGGPECLTDKQSAIQACANKTLGKHIPTDGSPSIDNLPLLFLGSEECGDMKKLQVCVVNELQKCEDPTPANIVEALFKYIYKVTPCGAMEKAQQEKASSSAFSATAVSLTLLVSSLGFILTLIK